MSKIPPRPIELRSDEIVNGVIGLIGGLCSSTLPVGNGGADTLIGNTPLIRINSLSDALGVEILVSRVDLAAKISLMLYIAGKGRGRR